MNPELLELTDQTDRTLIEQELEANIFVEAGAGSGKTHELVERICAMVDAGVELKSVAAITFTEKAAGELRERVRRRLTDASPTDLRRRALDVFRHTIVLDVLLERHRRLLAMKQLLHLGPLRRRFLDEARQGRQGRRGRRGQHLVDQLEARVLGQTHRVLERRQRE